MQEYVKKSPTMDCSLHVYECGRGPLGASYAIKSCARSSYMSGSVLSGANKRHAAPECDPLHGRRCRRHLQGGNGRIESTRGGSAGVLGPDLVLKCSYGLTLVKGRSVKVKGLDLRVNRARIRSVGGLGGINGTQTCIVS